MEQDPAQKTVVYFIFPNLVVKTREPVGLVQSVDAVPVWTVLGFDSPMAVVVIGLIPTRLYGYIGSVDPMVPGSLPMGRSTVQLTLQGGPMGVEWLSYIC